MFDEYIQNYRRNSGHPIRILLHFFKGSGRDLTISTIALIAKQSPMWVTPIVTRNIINCATDPASHSVTEMVINLIIGIFFIAQNIGTAYLYIRHFGKVNRLIERRLRGSLIAKLQQLSIRFHTETQSGRLMSKIMRDVENVEVLLDQTYRSQIAVVPQNTILFSGTLRTTSRMVSNTSTTRRSSGSSTRSVSTTWSPSCPTGSTP